MSCLKCGRDTEEPQVFCDNCLAEMEKHPVRPGTAVVLPKVREIPVVKKVSKRRIPSPEEQVKSLRRRIRWMTVWLVALLILVGVLAFPAYQSFTRTHYRPGQNYTTVTTAALESATADD